MSSNISCIELELSNKETIEFYSYPLDDFFICRGDETKSVSNSLVNILEDPENDPIMHSGDNKIFLGFSSDNPMDIYRVPLWLPIDLLNTHVCISGAIGSGKTSLSYRLISGALKNYGTVVIGEAKGAAFTDLAKYLSDRLTIDTYRWPRGNCWFNPLNELKDRQERRGFLESIVGCLKLSDEYNSFGDKVIDITLYLLDFLYDLSELLPPFQVTFRELVNILDPIDGPAKVKGTITELAKDLKDDIDWLNKIRKVHTSLELLDYFRLRNSEFIATRNVVSRLMNTLNSEDLMYYTESHKFGLDNQPLVQLKIDSILMNRSLLIISEPLLDPTSKVIGPIFWDALYSSTLRKGLYNPRNPNREKVLAIFDETDDLPTGKLGESGKFIRQYGIGLIEIMPSIQDHERWYQLTQVYQTFISLSPALLPVTKFIHEILPPEKEKPPFYPEISFNQSNSLSVNLSFDRGSLDPVETPGISLRSLTDTGRNTALLVLKNPTRIYWIDLESSLLKNFDQLLEDALSEKARPVASKAVDYALGLSTSFS